MAIRLEVSADVRQALQSLSKFSTEIDKAGGVTEAMALQIASALNLAASQFGKLDNVKVSNPIEFVTKEVSDSVDKLVISLGEASTGITAFNQTKVENPLDRLPAQASNSVDELNTIFSNLKQNISGLDFTTSIEDARLRLNATIDDITAKATGLNEAFGSIKGQEFLTLQSAFTQAEKSADQLEKEIRVLGSAFKETTDPVVLERFSRQLSELQNQLSQKLTPKVSFEKISAPVINTPFVAPDVSGIKSFAAESIRSLEGLQQELLRLGNELDVATSGGSEDVGRLKLAFDELKAKMSSIQATSLETAFQDTIKPVQQLENEITALQEAIRIGVNPTEINKFSERISVLQTQLANVKAGGVTIDTSKLSALQSAFIDAIKPVEQLEREIDALQAELNKTSNPIAITSLQTQINKLSSQVNNVRFNGLESSLNRLGGVSVNTANRLGQVPKASGSATNALINLGRVAQDAPFGIIGIANNINPLLESFQRLQKEAGSTGAAIKALGASFLGGGGLGLAVSLITSAMTFFALQSNTADKAIEKHKAEVDSAAEHEREFQQALDQATSSVIQQADKLGDLKSIFVSVTKEVDNLTAATVRQGAAQFLFNSKNEAVQKLLNAQVQQFLRLRTGVNTAPQFTFKGDENSLDPLTKQIATAKDDIRKANELATGLEDLFNNIFQKTFGKGGGVEKAKEKFQFLFDFLPFDPNGKMKPEQRSELLDAIDKFQKDFNGIIQGAFFTGDADNRIKQAKQLDLQIKAGTIKFDLTRIRQETEKALKSEDLIPKDVFADLPNLVVQQFLRAFDTKSSEFKNFVLPLPSVEATLEQAKQELQRLGRELPKIFSGKDVFGEPIELSLDDLFDASKISPADAIKAIENAVAGIKKANKTLEEQIIEDLRAKGINATNAAVEFSSTVSKAIQQSAVAAFSGFGDAIGQALAGNDFGSVFQGIFASLGGIIKQLGAEMIALSPIVKALRAAIKSLSPVGLLAAGVGLVAIGTLIQSSFNKVQKFSKGGIVPGTGNSDTVPALLTPGELVIPKNKVAEVQKLLQGSTKLQIPTQLLASLKNIALAGQNFNIPIRRLNTDAVAPLRRAQMALAGTAGQNVNVTVEGITKGNDIVYQVAKVLRSQNRNFGRGNF